MSVIIKSNNVAQATIGTIKMLDTSAQAEFDAYKTRVLADGGVIKDENRTLSAFNLLFDTKMYGNMNTCVSGTFGVKTNVNGGIIKLYAIDGADMEGNAYGTGTLPTLTPENNISFAANNATAENNANGGMFSTPKMRMSKTNTFGIALRISKLEPSSGKTLCALTFHADEVNSTSPLRIRTTGDALYYTNAAGKLSGNLNEPVVIYVKDYGYPSVALWSKIGGATRFGSRAGEQVTSVAGDIFEEIATRELYLDFGGAYLSNEKQFSNDTVRDFMCFNQATANQATQLSSFSD